MYVKVKDLKAQYDRMPPGSRFRVYGTLEVGHPGIVPTLVKRKFQDKSFSLALELVLEKRDGFFIQAVCDKDVFFEIDGDHSHIPKVDIFHDDELLTSITEILVTD